MKSSYFQRNISNNQVKYAVVIEIFRIVNPFKEIFLLLNI